VSTSAFWEQSGQVYQQENPRDPASDTGRTRQALKNRLTWILALFTFAYVGAEGNHLNHVILATYLCYQFHLVVG